MKSTRRSQSHSSRSRQRSYMWTALAVVVFVIIAAWPSIEKLWQSSGGQNPAVAATSQNNYGKGSALETLASLPVKGKAPHTGYSREKFGPAWADVDHNGCDTRNDVLKRDLGQVTFKYGKCVVRSGILQDPYTGKTINFLRGRQTSEAVQIDHVVALSNAWSTGAQQLSVEQRERLANDPYNLLAVDGPENQEKSDADAATWLPSNKGYRCAYVARQIGVKKKYSLWVTSAEKAAMQRVLNTCPQQKVPVK